MSISNGERLGGYEENPAQSERPENNQSEGMQKKYWDMLLNIESTLNSNSQIDIAILRDSLQNSSDETMQKFGGCLDQLNKRKDWQQAKVDAYQAAKSVFDEWVKKQEEGK